MAATTNAAEKTKMVKVKIPRISLKQGPQFVSVNNYTCLIKPGEEVEVPAFVAEVLQNREKMQEQIMLFEEKHK